MSGRLYIDLSRSTCGACGRNADPNESAHLMERMEGEGCGSLYDSVSSNYVNAEGLYERIQQMRPDLDFVPPFGSEATK